MQISVIAEGGQMKPGPALSQKLGPAGININQVIQKINEATKDFDGIKVPVEIDVDVATKTFEIKVFSPPVAELLKKELKITKGSGLQKKQRVANASIEEIISVAKTKLPGMLCKDLKAAVKTVAGTCVSLGVLIEGKPAVDVVQEIAQGKFDKEIASQSTQTSKEKRALLDAQFSEVKNKQEAAAKAEQAAKEAAEAAAAAATPAAGTTATATATPAAAATPAKKEEAKPAAKKK